jgi:ubiquinone/menaquinone biosynthesis C-methylase UbiE
MSPPDGPVPSWYLDEQAHAGPEHLDPSYVAGYDRKAGVDPAEDLTILRAHGLGPDSTLIDFGCGTGTLALAAAPVCARVIAVDVSPAMLAVLRTRLAQLELTNVDVVQAGLLSYQPTGAPADFVYARHCLHQLPDFWKVLALRHMATLLRPGGVLRVRDLLLACDPGDVNAVVEAWLARAAPDPSLGWTRAELETHLREEYSTFTWLFEAMLQRSGFSVEAATFADSRLYAAYTCVRQA